jgi:hypothetical protein
MKNTILHAITALLKLISAILIVLPALGFNSTYAALGGIAFVCISAAKDLLISLGDWIDNGKKDGSFKGPQGPVLAVTAALFATGLTGCESLTPEQQAALTRSAGRVLDAAADRLIIEIAGGSKPVKVTLQK